MRTRINHQVRYPEIENESVQDPAEPQFLQSLQRNPPCMAVNDYLNRYIKSTRLQKQFCYND